MTWLYFRETVKNVYFVVIAFAGVLFMITTATTSGDIFGTTTWPVTYAMLDLLSDTFSLFIIVIITLYAGELVWRERDNRLDQIQDALPIPTWLPLIAKLFALMLVPVLLQTVLMLCGIGIQTAKGYHNYELPLYLYDLYGIRLIDYWLICVLAIAVHALVNQKYLGHFIMTVYFILLIFASALGLRTQAVPIRRAVRIHLLGDERLRALPVARAHLPGVLRGDRAGSRGSRLSVLGTRHDDGLARSIGDRSCALRDAGARVRSVGRRSPPWALARTFSTTRISSTST